MRCLLSQKTLLDCCLDGGEHKLIDKDEADILWKLLSLESHKVFHITDLCLHKIRIHCRKLSLDEALVSLLEENTEIINVTKEIIDEARLSDSRCFDIEDEIDLICVSAFCLEAIVTHHPQRFCFSTSVAALTPKQLLKYLPPTVRLAVENETDFSDRSLREANLRGLDLSQKNLSGCDLYQVDLSDANLAEANLTGADLRGAHLLKTNLSGATLVKADLSRADLWGADLSNANLTDAILEEANLIEANLMDTQVTGVDFTSFDLSEADLSGIDLSEANTRDFTVRNISTLSELKQLWKLECYLLGESALAYDRLVEWWQAYPFGIKALFYQGKIVAGAFSIWPLSEETVQRLQEGITEGTFEEHELETVSIQFLQENQGTKYWYIGAIYLNKSLRVSKGNLGFNFMALLLFEAYKIWVHDEEAFIDKSSERINVFAISINENRTDVRDHVHRLLSKFGFERQSGEAYDHSPLYLFSKPFTDMVSRFERHLAWLAERTERALRFEKTL